MLFRCDRTLVGRFALHNLWQGFAVIIIIKMSNGSIRIPIVGTVRNQTIMPNNSTMAMLKSTSFAITAESGRTKRGKYTLLIKFAFVTRLFVLSVNALEK